MVFFRFFFLNIFNLHSTLYTLLYNLLWLKFNSFLYFLMIFVDSIFLCLIFCILDFFGWVVGWNEYMYIFDGQYMPDMGVRFIWPKWQLRAESRGAGIDCWHLYLEPISPLITGSTNENKAWNPGSNQSTENTNYIQYLRILMI